MALTPSAWERQISKQKAEHVVTNAVLDLRENTPGAGERATASSWVGQQGSQVGCALAERGGLRAREDVEVTHTLGGDGPPGWGMEREKPVCNKE